MQRLQGGGSAQQLGLDLWNRLKADETVLCRPHPRSHHFNDLNNQPLSAVLANTSLNLSELNIFKICISYQDLLKKVGLQSGAQDEFRAYPFIDGKILSGPSLLEKFKNGEVLRIPYIGGSAVDESSLISLRGVNFNDRVCKLLLPKAPKFLADNTPASTVRKKVQAIGELYGVNLSNFSTSLDKIKYENTMKRFFGDMQFSMPSRLYSVYQNRNLVEQFGVGTDKKAYTYEYGYLTERKRANLLQSLGSNVALLDDSTFKFIMSSAGHSQEAFAIFGKMQYLTINQLATSENDNSLSYEIISRWVRFAATGSPNDLRTINSSDLIWEPNDNALKVYEFFSSYSRARREMEFHTSTNQTSRRRVSAHFFDVFENPHEYSDSISDCNSQLSLLVD